MDSIKHILRSESPDSIGTMVRVLVRDYNLFWGNKPVEKEGLERSFKHRQLINRNYAEDANIFQHFSFDFFYEKLASFSIDGLDCTRDIAAWVLAVITYESWRFRQILATSSDDNCKEIYEVVYELCQKDVPSSLICTKPKFVEWANHFFALFRFEAGSVDYNALQQFSTILGETDQPTTNSNESLDDSAADTLTDYSIAFVDSFVEPWNLMYYDSPPSTKYYLKQLNDNCIPFTQKRIGSRGLPLYSIDQCITFNGINGEEVKEACEITVNEKGSIIHSLKIEDVFQPVVELIYQILQHHPDYTEQVTKTGAKGMYNQAKELWIVLSDLQHNSELGIDVKHLRIYFQTA